MRSAAYLLVALLACASLRSLVAQEAGEAYDVNKELEKLKGWKHYLQSELDKANAALKTEQDKTAQLTQQLTDANARATAAAGAADATAKVNELTAKVAELTQQLTAATTRATTAEAQATAAATAQKQAADAQVTIAQLQKDAADAKAKVAELDAKLAAQVQAAAAANGEANVLRTKLAEQAAKAEAAVVERQTLEARVAELANATAKAGGLRGHALAIYDILVDEAAKHRDVAINYANDKLPGLKAKITEVHAQVSAQLPKVNVTEHVGAFVGHVDGEIRPWLAQTLSAVPQLKKYGDDPVALQAIVYCIIGAPVVLLFSLLLSCCCRSGHRAEPDAPATVGGKRKVGKGKAKQG
ncbi:hypothetical protein CHLRE_17g707900v5 [Chlamydomonas reinhardtii]|uniref:Uncharacterized protein n=1 Tax=Chlamydomonas reinhardtii TaxID=3055 RepID=A8IR98_CHLRE|nr:uncharacterized protein CHLRE_17g707900v5 [Chlamydomonas reinhardtii]PNW70150.1 hypothetical protein CHLRE_17g707900v5 [Chlamydomonas reinhardtii]|eukprot:XP_001691552.1 hypothetical protein CHLREDRAFT_145156 [Chlamydomonas reinhardtii]